MAAGLQITKDSINQDAGSITRQLYSVMDLIRQFQGFLAATTNQNLLDLGYVQADIDSLKSAFTDMDQLRQVFEGTATRSVAYDYRAFASRLIGTRIY